MKWRYVIKTRRHGYTIHNCTPFFFSFLFLPGRQGDTGQCRYSSSRGFRIFFNWSFSYQELSNGLKILVDLTEGGHHVVFCLDGTRLCEMRATYRPQFGEDVLNDVVAE